MAISSVADVRARLYAAQDEGVYSYRNGVAEFRGMSVDETLIEATAVDALFPPDAPTRIDAGGRIWRELAYISRGARPLPISLLTRYGRLLEPKRKAAIQLMERGVSASNAIRLAEKHGDRAIDVWQGLYDAAERRIIGDRPSYRSKDGSARVTPILLDVVTNDMGVPCEGVVWFRAFIEHEEGEEGEDDYSYSSWGQEYRSFDDAISALGLYVDVE